MGTRGLLCRLRVDLGRDLADGAGELLGEAVATFTLLLTILGTLAHRPAAIALTVPAAITAGAFSKRFTPYASVVLPHPDGPINAVIWPR